MTRMGGVGNLYCAFLDAIYLWWRGEKGSSSTARSLVLSVQEWLELLTSVSLRTYTHQKNNGSTEVDFPSLACIRPSSLDVGTCYSPAAEVIVTLFKRLACLLVKARPLFRAVLELVASC